MTPETQRALEIIKANYCYFADPFLDQQQFGQWVMSLDEADKAKAIKISEGFQRLFKLRISDPSATNPSPIKLILAEHYTNAITGKALMPIDLECLRYCDDSRLVALLEQEPEFAKFITSIDESILAKYAQSHPEYVFKHQASLPELIKINRLINNIQSTANSFETFGFEIKAPDLYRTSYEFRKKLAKLVAGEEIKRDELTALAEACSLEKLISPFEQQLIDINNSINELPKNISDKKIAALCEQFDQITRDISVHNKNETESADSLDKLKYEIGVTKYIFLFRMRNQELDRQIEVLREKSKELANRGYKKQAEIAETLANNITSDIDKVLYNGQGSVGDRIELFQANAKQYINDATPELSKHRGYKQLLGNLTLAVMGLGLGYLAAICVNKAVRGKWLFFKATDSQTKLDKLFENINKLA